MSRSKKVRAFSQISCPRRRHNNSQKMPHLTQTAHLNQPWMFIFRWFSSTSRTHKAIDEEATSTASPALAHLPDRADKENCAPSQVKSSLNANVVRVARKSSLFNVTKNSSQQVAADPQEQIIPAERAQSRAFVSAVVPSRRYTSESSRTLAHMRKENHRLTRKKEELTRKLEILRQIPEQNVSLRCIQ